MKEFKYTYLHVPPVFAIQMGIDRVEQRTITIMAKTKRQADLLFSRNIKINT